MLVNKVKDKNFACQTVHLEYFFYVSKKIGSIRQWKMKKMRIWEGLTKKKKNWSVWLFPCYDEKSYISYAIRFLSLRVKNNRASFFFRSGLKANLVLLTTSFVYMLFVKFLVTATVNNFFSR